MILQNSIPDRAQTVLEIDLSAIKNNYQILVSKFSGSKVSAIIKDDAYSLGQNIIAPFLYESGCRDFFVANIDEGIALSELIKNANIYILNGVYEGASELMCEYNFIPTLISLNQVESWAEKASALGKKLPAVIHFDTGMNRTGLSDDETKHLIKNTDLLNHFDIKYYMSHLVCSDDNTNPLINKQHTKFTNICAQLPLAATTFMNSDGIFLDTALHCNMARPGIALYGYNTHADDLTPSLSLRAKILQIRDVRAGESIGYNATHTFKTDARVAILPIGYAHGHPISQSNTGFVAIDQQKCPLIGRVSMDLMAADISHIPADKTHENQWVEIFGDTISLKEVAKAGRTIPYEIILGLKNHHKIFNT